MLKPRNAFAFISVILLLCVGLFAASAQTPTVILDAQQAPIWQAWLYDAFTGGMTQVAAGGVVTREIILPMPLGSDTYPAEVAVSPSGRFVAYVTTDSASSQPQLTLVNTELVEVASSYIPEALGASSETQPARIYLQGAANNFSDDETSFAFSVSTPGLGWQVIVSDLVSDTSRNINGASPQMQPFSVPVDAVPVVQRYDDRRVWFTVLPPTEDAPPYSSFVWDLTTDMVYSDVAYPTLDTDTQTVTGEVIAALPDDRLPNTKGDFQIVQTQANSLHVYQPGTGARFPFYADANLSFFDPHFIQGGQLVLVSSYSATEQNLYWSIISRDGTLLGTLPTLTRIESVWGIVDGFLYVVDPHEGTTEEEIAEGSTLMYVDLTQGLNAGMPQFTSAPGTRARIVWVRDNRVINDFALMPPMLAWAQLAEPVFTSAPPLPATPVPPPPTVILPPTPVVIPVASPIPTLIAPPTIIVIPTTVIVPTTIVLPTVTPMGITINGSARVNAPDGEIDVRLEPRLDAEVNADLQHDNIVRVLNGPQSADNLTWWLVRGPEGEEGWVAENNNGEGIVPA